MKRAALLALALVACGGGESSVTPDAGAAVGNCKLTLSGDVSATLDCAATAGTMTGSSTSLLGVNASAQGPITNAALSVVVTGEPAVMDYTTFQSAGATVVTGAGATYAAAVGGPSDQGSVGTLHVTGLDFQGGSGVAKVWIMHGSVTATLVNLAGEGSVTFSATF